MTYRGHIKNGQILLDEPAQLPEGAEVQIEVIGRANGESDDLPELLLRHAGQGRGLPPDLAAEHDHYAHGKPKE